MVLGAVGPVQVQQVPFGSVLVGVEDRVRLGPVSLCSVVIIVMNVLDRARVRSVALISIVG